MRHRPSTQRRRKLPNPYKEGQPIKIIHQNTPWRGLSVLLGAMQLVNNPLISLDVYSSCEVYGKDFMEKNEVVRCCW